MGTKQSQPSYAAQVRRSKARHRAFTRLAAMHRAEFLRLLHEEQLAVEAEAKAAFFHTVREATWCDDPALRWAGLPVTRPQGWERAS